jgi:hypothetical protein
MPISEFLRKITPTIAEAKKNQTKAELRVLQARVSLRERIFGPAKVKSLDTAVLGQPKRESKAWEEEGNAHPVVE